MVRAPVWGVRTHCCYHTPQTPQMLKNLGGQLRIATPEPRSRHTRIPADVLQCATIIKMLPQHSHKTATNSGIFASLKAQVAWRDLMNQATQRLEQKHPATWQTGARYRRKTDIAALLQWGGNLGLLKQGPAAAPPQSASQAYHAN